MRKQPVVEPPFEVVAVRLLGDLLLAIVLEEFILTGMPDFQLFSLVRSQVKIDARPLAVESLGLIDSFRDSNSVLAHEIGKGDEGWLGLSSLRSSAVDDDLAVRTEILHHVGGGGVSSLAKDRLSAKQLVVVVIKPTGGFLFPGTILGQSSVVAVDKVADHLQLEKKADILSNPIRLEHQGQEVRPFQLYWLRVGGATGQGVGSSPRRVNDGDGGSASGSSDPGFDLLRGESDVADGQTEGQLPSFHLAV